MMHRKFNIGISLNLKYRNQTLKFNKVNEAKLDQGSEPEVKSLVINIHVVYFLAIMQNKHGEMG